MKPRAIRRWIERSGVGLMTPSLLVLLGVFVAPLLLLVPTSLHPYVPGKGIGTGWTLENYTHILGDPFYASGAAADYPRMMLHSEELRLSHPESGKGMRFRAEPDF